MEELKKKLNKLKEKLFPSKNHEIEIIDSHIEASENSTYSNGNIKQKVSSVKSKVFKELPFLEKIFNKNPDNDNGHDHNDEKKSDPNSPTRWMIKIGLVVLIGLFLFDDDDTQKSANISGANGKKVEKQKNTEIKQDLSQGIGESVNRDIDPDNQRVPNVNIPDQELTTGIENSDLENTISDINNQVSNTIGDVEIRDDFPENTLDEVDDFPEVNIDLELNNEVSNTTVDTLEVAPNIEDIQTIESEFNLNGEVEISEPEIVVEKETAEKPREEGFDLFDDKEKTIQMLKEASEKIAQKETIDNEALSEKIYTKWIDFRRRGRGLAYNCGGQHWACVDQQVYNLCKRSEGCHAKAIYKSERDCAKAQLDSMYEANHPCS